jgi:alkanesulfonate monooxygenase SsuD/methylene tetrahydromethanopterin reductase-like flavin-dependent oxidoreductase (luciferase family)
MRLAARYADTWVTTGDPTAGPTGPLHGAPMIAAQISRLEEACAAVDRDPATLRRLVLTGTTLDPGLESLASFQDTVGRYEEVGVTDLAVHWPRPSPPYAGDEATFERIFGSD